MHMDSSLRLDFREDCPSPRPRTVTITIMQQKSPTSLGAAPAMASPLTSLLSQYELLSMLCENLSSADIVHVGATSKEHWQYVGHNPVIFKGLIAESTCDGRGITAQARVFGHWKANPNNATRECRGKDVKPCSKCGAMVCNMCRYHLIYPSRQTSSELGQWDEDLDEDEDWDEDWDFEETMIGFQVNNADIEEQDVPTKVALVKAISMMDYRRHETHCDGCEPLLVPTRKPAPFCKCTVHSLFVEQWHCIPCFLREETNYITTEQKYTMEHIPHQTESRWVYQKKWFCKCGKPASDQSMETCRWCGMVIGYNRTLRRQAYLLKRVREQLGSWTDLERRGDPVLSQLG